MTKRFVSRIVSRPSHQQPPQPQLLTGKAAAAAAAGLDRGRAGARTGPQNPRAQKYPRLSTGRGGGRTSRANQKGKAAAAQPESVSEREADAEA